MSCTHGTTVNGKIIARLNNCTLLNFIAFIIYLWLKKLWLLHMVTLYNTYTRYTHAHYQEFIGVKFLRGLVVIAISQLLDLRQNFASQDSSCTHETSSCTDTNLSVYPFSLAKRRKLLMGSDPEERTKTRGIVLDMSS